MNLIEEELLLMDLQAEDPQEAITRLGELLFRHGYVKESYLPAALERERVYATGVATSTLPVAIPHAGCEHVLRTGIAVGILEQPVEFGQMGDPTHTLPVQIVLLLAIRQSSTVERLMGGVVEMLQDAAFLHSIVEAREKHVIINLFRERLMGLRI